MESRHQFVRASTVCFPPLGRHQANLSRPVCIWELSLIAIAPVSRLTAPGRVTQLLRLAHESVQVGKATQPRPLWGLALDGPHKDPRRVGA